MSLGSALSSATSGLRATQQQLDVISGNVANSGTVGYSKRIANLQETVGNGDVNGVTVAGVQRKLDAILQRELRTETSGSGYTSVRSDFSTQLGALFGQPGSDGSLSTLLNGFTSSLQGLTSDPGSSTTRATVISSAGSLASGLNRISDGIQGLRSNAESQIGIDVQRVNQILQGIASADVKIAGKANDAPALQDQRDSLINELSKYLDVRVQDNPNGTVSLTTQSGLRLYDSGVPSTFSFDGRGQLTPQSLWSATSSRGVGTITLSVPGGTATDVIASGSLRSGELYGLIELRDKTLVDAQGQVDELAANLASTLSDRIPTATPFPASGTQTGLTINAAGLQRGNVISVTYKPTAGGTPQTYSFVMVQGSNTVTNAATPDPNDTVVAYDVSGGLAGLATLIQTTLGGNVQATATPSGTPTSLNVFSAGPEVITGLTGRITSTGAKDNSPVATPELPLFVDGAASPGVFTNYTDGSSQKLGFAGRIALNKTVASQPSLLVDWQTGTLAGDPARPQLLLDRLSKAQVTFAPQAGLGTATAPYTSTVADYANQVVAVQAGNASSAQRLDEGQKVVQASIESRFSASSGVSVDEELSNLIQVQNAYAANARIVSAVKEMMDLLLRI
jgi:flagellar hook-associated protein 1 FlgK